MKQKKSKNFFIRLFKVKHFLYLAVVCFFVFSLCMISASKTEFVAIPKDSLTVVVDAGHGGIDGGSVGKFTGVIESELNLIFAKNLQKQLEEYGFRVIMTRSGREGLYDKNASNLKKSDMKKRKEIIQNSNCDILLSIHMNSFPLESSCGAQVFYDKLNAQGKALATSVQTQLKNTLQNTNKLSRPGDYYIVNCTSVPAALIECGFLTNKQEESLLQQKSYQDKFCYAIVCGLIDYLGVRY